MNSRDSQNEAVDLPIPEQRPEEQSRSRKGRATPRYTRLFVCHVCGSELHGVLMSRGRSAVSCKPLTVSLDEAAPRRFPRKLSNAAVIVLLPKSHYLLRFVALPRADQAMVGQMLQMEAEAKLPPEYGPVYVSCREVPTPGQGQRAYEAFVARKADIDELVATLTRCGLRPDVLLPSSMIWVEMLGQMAAGACVAGQTELDAAEAATLASDGQLLLRNVPLGHSPEDRHEAIAECVRPLIASSAVSATEPVVHWFGGDQPENAGSVTFQRQQDELLSDTDDRDYGWVTGAGRALLELADTSVVTAANLLPTSLLESRHRRAVQRRLIAAATLFLASLLAVWSGLRIATARYALEATRLESSISGIRTSGERVGRQIEQMRAVRAALMTREDFTLVIAGLHEGTPAGVHYNQMSLDDQGRLKVRGYADSLALPFLLPEKLEPLPVFTGVKLIDAGQSKQAGGSVAEFRIEAQLARPAGGAK
jgi:hypothetical protein